MRLPHFHLSNVPVPRPKTANFKIAPHSTCPTIQIFKIDMSKTVFQIAATVVVVFGLCLPKSVNGQTNIIQIVADDLSWVDLSTGATNLGNGSPYHQTPNIDALATAGMSFTSAYVQQSCAPTRAALFTGQYAPRSRVYTVGRGLENPNNSLLLVVGGDDNVIQNSAITMAETLQDAGYLTAHFGKFQTTSNSNQIVSEHGFQINVGGTTAGGLNGALEYFAQESQPGVWQFGSDHGTGFNIYADPYDAAYIGANLLPNANGNDPTPLVNTPKHLNDAMADAAVEFLEERAGDGQKFFVNLAFNAVHVDINSRSDLEQKYAGLQPSIVPDHSDAAYAGLLEGLDQAVGRIVDFVKTSDLAGNTLIIFVSDNGGTCRATDNFPLAGGKGDFTEGGIRVPLIAYQPGVIEAGTVSNQIVHAVDFYKTYAEIAGATLPNESDHALDGESFANILNGQATELGRQTIFYHFPGYSGGDTPMSLAIHQGTDGNHYKLLYEYEDRSFELYDLTNDLPESIDLIQNGMTNSQFVIARRLASELGNWTQDVAADLPLVRATGNPVPALGHSPSVRFDLSSDGLGQELDGEINSLISQLGIEMTVEAMGQNPVFDVTTSGLGVRSDLDSGGGNQQGRIDGTLATAEKIVVSFDQDVIIKQINTNQLSNDGTETAVIEFVSGDNPFLNISGYDTGGFTNGGDRLSFVRSDNGGNDFSISLGTLDQDELFLTSGTKISITANPSTGGGFALGHIDIALPEFLLGDVNRDGVVDFNDIPDFVAVLLSGNFQNEAEADINGDGVVDFNDIPDFVTLLLGN